MSAFKSKTVPGPTGLKTTEVFSDPSNLYDVPRSFLAQKNLEWCEKGREEWYTGYKGSYGHAAAERYSQCIRDGRADECAIREFVDSRMSPAASRLVDAVAGSVKTKSGLADGRISKWNDVGNIDVGRAIEYMAGEDVLYRSERVRAPRIAVRIGFLVNVVHYTDSKDLSRAAMVASRIVHQLRSAGLTVECQLFQAGVSSAFIALPYDLSRTSGLAMIAVPGFIRGLTIRVSEHVFNARFKSYAGKTYFDNYMNQNVPGRDLRDCCKVGNYDIAIGIGNGTCDRFWVYSRSEDRMLGDIKVGTGECTIHKAGSSAGTFHNYVSDYCKGPDANGGVSGETCKMPQYPLVVR